MHQVVKKKLILWYQISNSSIQNKFGRNDKIICDWFLRLETVCKIKVEEIQIIALPWFAVPSLMTNLFS